MLEKYGIVDWGTLPGATWRILPACWVQRTEARIISNTPAVLCNVVIFGEETVGYSLSSSRELGVVFAKGLLKVGAFRDKLLEDDAGSDSESIYELERIEGYKKWGKKEEFFVKWRGYSSAENTWEPLKNLTGVSIEEIEEARQKYSAKKAAPKRGSRKNGKDAQSSDTHSHVESELDAPDSLGGADDSPAAWWDNFVAQ